MISLDKRFILLLMCLSLLGACKDNWDEHASLDSSLGSDLIAKIKGNPELSKFSEFLSSTGYDETLASSKSFTVWAPTNQALDGLDDKIINDPVLLRQFVGNHICYQEYFTQAAQPSVRIKMVNGKYLNWFKDNFEGAELISSNQFTRNGVLHVIDSAITPQKSIWEKVVDLATTYKEAAYIQSLNFKIRVDSLAKQIGVDPLTGLPIYEEGTGYIDKNRFFDNVAHIENEDSLFTFILLEDDAFDAEIVKLSPFFETVTNDLDSTKSLSTDHLIKDFVIKGLVKPENLPDTLLSMFKVKVPIDKTAIKDVFRTSNGIVYLMKKVNFQLKDKFPPIIIEGENVTSFSNGLSFNYSSSTSSVARRFRSWASGNTDLLIKGVSGVQVKYRIKNLSSGSFMVYWRAVNDFQLTTFSQKVVADSKPSYVAPFEKDFGLKTIDLNNFSEVNVSPSSDYYLHQKYGTIYLYVVANGNSPVVLDYIKIVPLF